MAASQTSRGQTCVFNYVFIHFFNDFIVNYRFASAFIPESRADLDVAGFFLIRRSSIRPTEMIAGDFRPKESASGVA
jgi:hypothetical protein